jgi:hypothetical protein
MASPAINIDRQLPEPKNGPVVVSPSDATARTITAPPSDLPMDISAPSKRMTSMLKRGDTVNPVDTGNAVPRHAVIDDSTHHIVSVPGLDLPIHVPKTMPMKDLNEFFGHVHSTLQKGK